MRFMFNSAFLQALWIVAVLAIELCRAQGITQAAYPESAKYIEPESYRVYSAVLISDWSRLSSNGTVNIRSSTDDLLKGMPLNIEDCFTAKDAVPASSLESFKTANQRRWLLQRQLEVPFEYKLTNSAVSRFVQFSAVGFSSGRDVAVVRMIEGMASPNSTTIDGESATYELGKQGNLWKLTAVGCRAHLSIVSDEFQAGSPDLTSQLPNTSLTGAIRLDSNVCSRYTGVFKGEFFSRLGLVRTTQGLELESGGTAVTSFPDKTMISLVASLDDCSQPGPILLSNVPPAAQLAHRKDLLGLRFTAYWDDGKKQIPVSELKVTEIPPPDWNEYSGAYVGRYDIEIPSKGAPLSRKLVLCASSDDEKHPVCMTSDLNSPASAQNRTVIEYISQQ